MSSGEFRCASWRCGGDYGTNGLWQIHFNLDAAAAVRPLFWSVAALLAVAALSELPLAALPLAALPLVIPTECTATECTATGHTH